MNTSYKKEIANLKKQLKALTLKANRENNKQVIERDYADLLNLTYTKYVDDSSNPGVTSITYENTFNVKKTTYKDKFVLSYDQSLVYVTRYSDGTGSIMCREDNNKREYDNNRSHDYWTNKKLEKISEIEFNLVWNACSDALTRCI